MKVFLFTLGIATFLFLVYIISINAIAFTISEHFIQESVQKNLTPCEAEICENIGFSESIEVSIIRKRWYGTILESGSSSYLSFFNLIKLPMKINARDIRWLHVIIPSMILLICSSFYLGYKILNTTPTTSGQWQYYRQ